MGIDCAPEMDYKTIGDLFLGLASSGAWGMFDELNRCISAVLSTFAIHVESLLDGLRAGGDTFRFNGADTSLDRHTMILASYNVSVKGRSELPEFFTKLFRPVTMVVPDYRLYVDGLKPVTPTSVETYPSQPFDGSTLRLNLLTNMDSNLVPLASSRIS